MFESSSSDKVLSLSWIPVSYKTSLKACHKNSFEKVMHNSKDYC